LVGCQDKWQEPERHGCGDGNGALVIQMASDTLVCWQGDMASIIGWVQALDCYGEPAPDFHVSLNLSQPFGSLEPLNGDLGHTTNQDGRVEFRYLLHTTPTAGSQVITAEVGGVGTQWVLAFGPTTGMMYRAAMTVDPDTIHLLTDVPFSDSTLVSVTVSDAQNTPPACPEFSLPIWVLQGVLDPYPTLDSIGSTTAMWHLPRYPGTYYVHALHDSVRVVVDTLQSH
jgi:hypothetical protein